MNLLEHYIGEVYSVEEVKCDWGSFIKVDLQVSCYGNKERVVETFADMEEWDLAVKRGYYMA